MCAVHLLHYCAPKVTESAIPPGCPVSCVKNDRMPPLDSKHTECIMGSDDNMHAQRGLN